MGSDDAVLKYLSDQNRPYSANDIFMNMHKEFGKTAIQKSLDNLVEKSKIKEKVYGKQKVYAVQQAETNSNDAMSKELNDFDIKINEVSENLISTEQQLRASENQFHNLQSTLTTEEAINEQKELQKRIIQLQEKVQHLSQNSVPISPKEREKIQKECEKNIKEWRKRKSLCNDIVNSILESYPKEKKVFLEEVGIETDEDASVCLPKS